VSVVVNPVSVPEAHAGDSKAGSALLMEVRSFLKRFCSFPDEHALTAVTLWAAHAHMVRHFHTTPRLALISPEPGSGKTRVLEILDLLVSKSMFCLSASPAAIFRTLAKGPITLLVDECDTIFTRRGRDDANEDLRALLNSGYKRGATIPRCVGPKHDVQNFTVYCAAALFRLRGVAPERSSPGHLFRDQSQQLRLLGVHDAPLSAVARLMAPTARSSSS
jgi:hypothetical protein